MASNAVSLISTKVPKLSLPPRRLRMRPRKPPTSRRRRTSELKKELVDYSRKYLTKDRNCEESVLDILQAIDLLEVDVR